MRFPLAMPFLGPPVMAHKPPYPALSDPPTPAVHRRPIDPYPSRDLFCLLSRLLQLPCYLNPCYTLHTDLRDLSVSLQPLLYHGVAFLLRILRVFPGMLPLLR
jgi:hypothetical protein